MARVAGISLLLALSLGAAWAEPVLQCKQEIAVISSRSGPPTDVAVDSLGRAYVLYEGEGFLDIYADSGKLLQHRGGEAERSSQLANIAPLSMWVGRLGRSALLVSEPGQQIARAVLVPDGDQLLTVPLRGNPEPMVGPAALARDSDGRFYVWLQNGSLINVFDSHGKFSSSVPLQGTQRPVQLAVDGEGQIYCLDSAGLQVYQGTGERVYDVAGATAMYLTGSGRLALAGRDWIRRYNHEGHVEIENKSLDLLKTYEPVAISLNDDDQFFVYGRDPLGGPGLIQKLNSQGEALTDFPQPSRPPAAPDPGSRLDYEGRLRVWDNKKGRWLKLHPGGKLEKSWSFVPQSDSRGHLSRPAQIVIDGDDTAFIADTGNCRIQRFNLAKGGWLQSFSLGIRGGDARGAPRSLALGRGIIYCVVYPPRGVGDIVLQSRSPEGKLLSQRSICGAQGDPVVKVACGPTGDVFLYQSRTKVGRGWEDLPSLTRFSRTFQKLAHVGGENLGLTPPGSPNERLFLKPQEDIVPYGQGLLMATNGLVYRLNAQLNIDAAYKLQLKSRGSHSEDFGGAYLHKQLLLISDIGNRCVQRAILP